MQQSQEKLRATNHYLHYPDEPNVPIYLAYGFRIIFLLVAPYVVLSMVLWGLVWSGVLELAFMQNVLAWHIHEMIFGILTAGTMAFLTTGLPELFPGTVPLIGKRLKYVAILWVAGRISFWFIDITGIYLSAFLNLAMVGWLIWFAKDAVLDKLQRHASIGYALVAIFSIEVWFFASMLEWVESDAMAVLRVALGATVVLVLLALRRVNMEAINELLEDKGIDDVYISRPPLTNFAIFNVVLFSSVEFFYPQSSTLGWLGLSAGASILSITSSYILKEKFILNQPYVIYLALVYVMFALGYASMGWAILSGHFEYISALRHLISSGGYGLAFMMVMIIVSWIHTGRQLEANLYTHSIVALIIIAASLRAGLVFFEAQSSLLYTLSWIFWASAFVLYMKHFFIFLLSPRADGVQG